MTTRPRRTNEIGPAGKRMAGNLKAIRTMRGLTTEELAELVWALGRPMHATTITKIETRIRRVDVDDLVAIAAALGVTFEQLLSQPSCEACYGAPPAGFTCNACGSAA